MKCKNPLATHGMLYGCGQCMPCRFNKRRVWTHRIMLEAAKHEHNAFVTLTYDDEHLPGDGSLDLAHVQKFLKRLRAHISPLLIRYFAVGEYGDVSFRPHYHLCLFGFPTCRLHQSTFNKDGLTCCQLCKDVERIWGYGNVYLGRLEENSARYCGGYVQKKMTMAQDGRLEGRRPEFARMSLKPGLGASAMEDVWSGIRMEGAVTSVDVTEISYGKDRKPLGRYLTRRLRSLRGLNESAPQSYYDKVSEELRAVRLVARADSEKPSYRSHYLDSIEGKIKSFEARQKIFSKGKRL